MDILDIVYIDVNQLENFMRDVFSPEAFSGYILCVLSEKYNTILVSDYKKVEELEKSGIKIYRDVNEVLKEIKYEYKKISHNKDITLNVSIF